MAILSPSVSMTRYFVEGNIEGNIIETLRKGLKNNSFPEIDESSVDKSVGWTSFDNPFKPNFDDSSFIIGNSLVFSLRIDKRVIPPKVLKKHYEMEVDKRLKETGREFLSQNEKRLAREHVKNILTLRIPATPNLFDIIWNYEDSILWFLSNQKSANEEIENLFLKSFELNIIRLFPFHYR